MRCAWKEFMAIVPQRLRQDVDRHRDNLQELRLRMGQAVELICANGHRWLEESVTEQDLRYTVNAASRYSPWAGDSAAAGYITAPGGHRVGICGEAVTELGKFRGVRSVSSLNIRVARDIPNLGEGLPMEGNVLILGPPGSGKTTLLRSYSRRLAQRETVAVVDERGELFPEGFARGRSMDVLSGCGKGTGMQMLLRTMGPAVIALDEITAREDCEALAGALWCGVRVIATAHARDREDLLRREVYRPIVRSGCFDTLVILDRDKTWRKERMDT